jgi:alkanesulfonate monooxygenase SsuD/methylene tetrahydromethanopterin reductase-like flavin-dependent oxidoreductase (luciferase family)
MMGSRMTSRAHVAQPAGTLPAEPVRTIDLSLMFFSADERAPSCLEFVMKAVEFADAAGLKAVWFPERHSQPGVVLCGRCDGDPENSITGRQRRSAFA